jgi:hypothetical protein
MIWKACASLAVAVILTLTASAVEAAPPGTAFVGDWWSLNPPSGPDATLNIRALGGRGLFTLRLQDADDDLFCEGAVMAFGVGHLTGPRELTAVFLWRCLSDGSTTLRVVPFKMNPVHDDEMAYFVGGHLSLDWHKSP